MYVTYKKYLIFLLFFSMSLFLKAETIDISKENKLSLLENTSVYFDKENHTFSEAKNKALYTPDNKPYNNRSISSESIWIKFTLVNTTTVTIEKILLLSSPLVEYIGLYIGTLILPS